MIVALVIKPILTNIVCRCKSRFHIAKFIRYCLMNIADPRILINLHLWIFHLNQLHCRVQNIRVKRGHSRHRIAYVAHLINSQGILILARRQNPKFLWQILACEYGQHTRQRQSLICINGKNTCMSMRRAQQPPIDHTREHDIVSIECASGHFAIGINHGPRRADNAIVFFR